MLPIGGKKAIPLCVLDILKQFSDEDHILSSQKIRELLSKNYGIDAERKAIARNVSLLCEMGYDISTFEENRHGYFLREREFTDGEIRMLIDSVLSSRFIPHRHADDLIQKLKSLSTQYFANRLRHIQSIAEWHHQRNDAFFLNLEVIDEAIEDHKQISFVYNEYGTDGQLHPKRQTRYVVSPYQVVCFEGQYYAIANTQGHDNLSHYRLDLMTDIHLEEDARPLRALPGFEDVMDIGRYTREHPFMFSGIPERIVLRMPKAFAGQVVSKFGKAATMRDISLTEMEVCVIASIQGMRFWVLQYGPFCQIISPSVLAEAFENDLQAMIERKNER